ncbi:glycolate oxidase subunit GlcF [Microbaculum marinum]|uniref:Glycolate oxidase iron-sulfur subunit n=1 Tax=Microbaculum marinum TaxID=1764581 RepID=A0AAW9RX74_9HYPH
METRFTDEQRTDPIVAGAEPILKTCVHYGFCTATCPTYVLTRDENDGPRGRIDLIRDMLEKGGSPDPKTVHYLDRCLSCLGCMTTCAVSIDYVHLIDLARSYIERNYRRPLAERLARTLIASTIPYPGRMRTSLALARIVKPLRGAMPPTLRSMLDMAPGEELAAPDPHIARTYPAEGDTRKRVALLAGCAQQVLDRAINDATIRLLTRMGCEVVVLADAGCCGALTLHMGKTDHGKRQAERNLKALARENETNGIDAFIINASGCGTVVKDYGHLFAGDADLTDAATWLSGITRDVSEFVAEIGLPEPAERRGYRVAYHDACSLRHGQKVTRPPRQLLKQAGYVVADVPEGHICCGSAGVYNILQPEIAGELGRRKADHAASTDPDILCMGNIGCLTQLRRYTAIPTVHTVELLDWATGGPMPPRLVGHALRDPIPQIEDDTPPRPGPDGASASFW